MHSFRSPLLNLRKIEGSTRILIKFAVHTLYPNRKYKSFYSANLQYLVEGYTICDIHGQILTVKLGKV